MAGRPELADLQVALAGRLAGIPTIDQVVTDFRNDERFARETAEARALGYQGKLCIHPRQVTLANLGFVPSDYVLEDLDERLEVLDAAAPFDPESDLLDRALLRGLEHRS